MDKTSVFLYVILTILVTIVIGYTTTLLAKYNIPLSALSENDRQLVYEGLHMCEDNPAYRLLLIYRSIVDVDFTGNNKKNDKLTTLLGTTPLPLGPIYAKQNLALYKSKKSNPGTNRSYRAFVDSYTLFAKKISTTEVIILKGDIDSCINR